jgi:hypothetical protein
MPLFKGRSSLLEVQNQALIKTARERAARIDELERNLQHATKEVERLTLERDFYSKKASALEEENRQLTESATKYSLWGQNLERELARMILMVRLDGGSMHSTNDSCARRPLDASSWRMPPWPPQSRQDAERPCKESPALGRGLELRGSTSATVSAWRGSSMADRGLPGGVPSSLKKNKPRTEAGLESWRVARINDNSNVSGQCGCSMASPPRANRVPEKPD